MFIEEGKMNDDPFLVNMGLWWKQQYFDSINSIGSMVDEVNAKMRSRVMDDQPQFNIYTADDVGIDTRKKDESPKDPLNSYYPSQYPVLAGRTMMLPEFIEFLKDHHIIK